MHPCGTMTAAGPGGSWQVTDPGVAGQVLVHGGPAALPAWKDPEEAGFNAARTERFSVSGAASITLQGGLITVPGMDTGVDGFTPTARRFAVEADVTLLAGPAVGVDVDARVVLRLDGVEVPGTEAPVRILLAPLLNGATTQQVRVKTWATPGVTAGVADGVPLRYDVAVEFLSGLAGCLAVQEAGALVIVEC